MKPDSESDLDQLAATFEVQEAEMEALLRELARMPARLAGRLPKALMAELEEAIRAPSVEAASATKQNLVWPNQGIRA